MNKLIILLALLLVSCDDQVIITKEEYAKLKGAQIQPLTVNGDTYNMCVGNDGHTYLMVRTYAYNTYVHYIECPKCKQLNDSINETNITRIIDSLRPKL